MKQTPVFAVIAFAMANLSSDLAAAQHHMAVEQAAQYNGYQRGEERRRCGYLEIETPEGLKKIARACGRDMREASTGGSQLVLMIG